MMARPRLVKSSPNPGAVRMAREICTRVERGEVLSLACAMVLKGGSVSTLWAAEGDQFMKLSYGASVLSHRLIDDGIREAKAGM